LPSAKFFGNEDQPAVGALEQVNGKGTAEVRDVHFPDFEFHAAIGAGPALIGVRSTY